MKVGYEKTFTIRYNVHIFPYLYIANHVIAHDVKNTAGTSKMITSRAFKMIIVTP